MATSIGSLFVDLKLSTASFAQGLARARNLSLSSSRDIQRSLSLIGKTVAGIGISFAAGAAVLVKKSIDAADHLNELAQSAGTTVTVLSSFKLGAEQSGISVEQLASGLGKLSRTMFEAGSGSKEAAQLFKGLGVEFQNSNGSLRDSQEVLLEVAEKFAGLQDGAAKTALAVKLFGKSGADLIPFLNQGRVGLAAMAEEAKRLGLVIDNETARAADQFNDNLKQLQAATQTFGNALAQELLPIMVAFTNEMKNSQGNSTLLADTAKILADALRVLITVVSTLVTELRLVSIALRGFIEQMILTTAAVRDFIALDFRGSAANLRLAIESFKDRFREASGAVMENGRRIDSVWGKDMASVNATTDAARANLKKLSDEFLRLKVKPPPGLQAMFEAAGVRPKAQLDLKDFTVPKAPKEGRDKRDRDLVARELADIQERLRGAEALNAVSLKSETIQRRVAALNEAEATITRLNIQLLEQKKDALTEEQKELIRSTALKISDIEAETQANRILHDHTISLEDEIQATQRLADATGQGYQALQKATAINAIDAMERQRNAKFTAEQRIELERLYDALGAATRAQQIEQRAFELDPVKKYVEVLQELQEVLARHPELWRQVQQASDDAWREMIQNSREGSDGVRRALYDINRAAKDVAASMEALFKTAFSGLRESLIDIVAEGKLSFGDLGRELRRQIAGIALDKLVIGPLSGALGKIFGIPEAEKKPLGTASDPIHVTMAGIGGLFGGQQDLGLQSGSLEDQVAGILDQWGSAAQSTEGAFGKAAESTKSGFAGVLSSIAGSLKGLFGSILQGLSGALSGIGGFFSKIFGGGGTASLTSGLGGFIPFLAEGGISEAGHGIARSAKVAIFGEAGPEAFIPLKRGMVPLALGANGLSVALPGGRMIPASFEKFATGGIINEDRIRFNPRTPRGLRLMEDSDSSGGITVNQHWNITTPNADSFKQSQRQIQVTAFSAANRWTTRNNRK